MTVSKANVDRLLQRLAQLDDGPGPADSIDGAHAQALIRGALERGGVGASGPQVCSSPPAKVVRLSRGFMVGASVIAATAAAAALGAGVAGGWFTHGTGPDSPNQNAVVSGQHNPNSTVMGHPQAGRPAAAAEAEAATTAPEGAKSTGSLQSPAESMERSSLKALPPPRGHQSLQGPPRAAAPPRSAPEAALSEPEPAVGLLAQANQYRRQKQYRRAHRAYLEVIERYPGSRQAEAARVAAAALRLEHLSDAKGAAEQYRAAASDEGQLGEEASYGLAEAHRASGRHDLERRQLHRFLRKYSASPLATAARRRLQELERYGK